MDEMEIVGAEETSFTGKDGTQITGKTFFGLERIAPNRGIGKRAVRFFLSTAKLASLDFVPTPGQRVDVLYNRYGKPQVLRLLSGSEDDMLEIS